MNAELITLSKLTPSDCNHWLAIQEAEPQFDSPFFRPEFAADVAAVRDGIRILRIDDNKTLGFLPVHVDHRGVATGPAETMSDFEGMVSSAVGRLNIDDAVRVSGLKAWRFSHLVAANAKNSDTQWAEIESPYIDLANGFDAYRSERLSSRGRLVKEIERKMRKAEREVGEVTFTFDDRDPAALDWIVTQKSAQLKARREWNFLHTPWAVPLYRKTLSHHKVGYRGLVSTLRHNGKIVAGHVGLQSNHVLHAWTHVFDPDESKHSPGMVMLYRLAREAAENGITRIDLGRGEESYKSRFANGSIAIAEGAVETKPIARLLRKSWFTAREAVRSTAVAQPAQLFVRKLRNWSRAVGSTTARQ